MVHPWRIFWKESIFSEMRPKIGFNLYALRNTFQHLQHLKIHHAFIIFIKSLLRPWRISFKFYSKIARYSVHLKGSSMRIFWKETVPSQMRPKLVLTCLRLETRSNIFYFWSFTIHSLSSSNFFLRPWCTSTPFFSKRARCFVHLSGSSLEDILKGINYFRDETKNWF